MNRGYRYTQHAERDGQTLLDFEEVRRRVPLTVFLESLGCEVRAEGSTYRLRCPLHREQHGASMILYPPDGRWYCHGKCQRGGDIVDLAGAFWGLSDPREITGRLLNGEMPQLDAATPRQAPKSQPSSVPKWPARELDELDAIVRSGPHLYDLWERSPCRFEDDGNHCEQIIDTIFPGNPLLCCGRQEWRFATRRRSDWRGRLSTLPLIVPNPMLRGGGTGNVASGFFASVSGGGGNTASGVEASVIGEQNNDANLRFSIRPQPPFSP